jgi:uncharacterized protein (DUF362 family)
MIVTRETSMKRYRELVTNTPDAPFIANKQRHDDSYKKHGKNIVSIVHTEDREKGIRKAVMLLGGMKPMLNNVKGTVLIKPNCNTDDPYPRDSHHDTVKTIAQLIIETGFPKENIIVGDMSGRARGLPTRATMKNLGITDAAEDLGIKTMYFDEEKWVTVKPTKSKYWPNGIKIPETVYNAQRIIFTPILRSHTTATFTCSLKLGVGLVDAENREWLHNGEDFYGKMMDINLAYQVDMVIADALKMNTGYGTDPADIVEPRIITASNHMVASDAVSAALMKKHGTVRVKDTATNKQKQFKHAKILNLGEPSLKDIELTTHDMIQDNEFQDQVDYIKSELR